MSEQYNMGQLGVVAPFKVKEGTITMTTTNGVGGDKIEPVLSAAVEKGDFVKLTDDFQVIKTTDGSDFIIGRVYNNPKWETEPRTNYTQAQAVSADLLREVGIETIFKKILTVPAKASEGITAGKFVLFKASGVELSSSSGATETKYLALTDQDSTANTVVVGFI